MVPPTLVPSCSDCRCSALHQTQRVVLTGGPGAGKTAVLELIRKAMCAHVRVLPESAGILFAGGFPRRNTVGVRRAVQRAIFYVQRELEASVEGDVAIALCDRATVDGVAYWPGPNDMFASVGTSLDEQLARYHAVIHLRTPSADNGYNHANPLRIESALEAAAIDEKIAVAWGRHPRRFEVPASQDFLAKAAAAIELVRALLPACCREHAIEISGSPG